MLWESVTASGASMGPSARTSVAVMGRSGCGSDVGCGSESRRGRLMRVGGGRAAGGGDRLPPSGCRPLLELGAASTVPGERATGQLLQHFRANTCTARNTDGPGARRAGRGASGRSGLRLGSTVCCGLSEARGSTAACRSG